MENRKQPVNKQKTEIGHFRKTSFRITLEVVDGVLSVLHEGDVSYWDEIGIAESYRALLRVKVLHDYQWPAPVATTEKVEQ